MARRISILSMLLIITFLLYPAKYVTAETTYTRIISDTQAVVVQIIDGETLRVRPTGTNQMALVRLAGVATLGRRDAHDFISGALLGRTVDLTISASAAITGPHDRLNDRWTPVYLTHNNVVYNRALVQRGLAWVDPEYQSHWLYETLLADAARARSARLGIWSGEGFRTQPGPGRRRGRGTPWDERVNINTATSSQINRLVGIGAGSEIVRFRNTSPFQTVEEVKFTGEFSRDDFDYYWGAMKVSTNINTASEEELTQLINVSNTDARNIVRFRDRTWFSSIYQLTEAGLISASAFEANRPFIAVSDVDEITAAIPNVIVDVNTASAYDLQRAGLTQSQADAVVNSRVNGYTIKSIGELTRMPGVNLTDRRLHEIADNIRVDTDAWGNRGVWRRPVLININTATRSELWRAGFSEQQANLLVSRRGRMGSARDIPFDVSAFDHAITLFTNINTATEEEWMSLSPHISSSFARTLASESLDQPFGTWWELEDFFYEYGYDDIIRDIRRYLVLR